MSNNLQVLTCFSDYLESDRYKKSLLPSGMRTRLVAEKLGLIITKIYSIFSAIKHEKIIAKKERKKKKKQSRFVLSIPLPLTSGRSDVRSNI